ncbi:hypothetical protein DL93DRAFT_2174249 [Clavulina sp. PMI_390]|nr:hypothetical protein DL93DRAFT_2174249 [Clavulina sp. PMI_390]
MDQTPSNTVNPEASVASDVSAIIPHDIAQSFVDSFTSNLFPPSISYGSPAASTFTSIDSLAAPDPLSNPVLDWLGTIPEEIQDAEDAVFNAIIGLPNANLPKPSPAPSLKIIWAWLRTSPAELLQPRAKIAEAIRAAYSGSNTAVDQPASIPPTPIVDAAPEASNDRDGGSTTDNHESPSENSLSNGSESPRHDRSRSSSRGHERGRSRSRSSTTDRRSRSRYRSSSRAVSLASFEPLDQTSSVSRSRSRTCHSRSSSRSRSRSRSRFRSRLHSHSCSRGYRNRRSQSAMHSRSLSPHARRSSTPPRDYSPRRSLLSRMGLDGPKPFDIPKSGFRPGTPIRKQGERQKTMGRRVRADGNDVPDNTDSDVEDDHRRVPVRGADCPGPLGTFADWVEYFLRHPDKMLHGISTDGEGHVTYPEQFRVLCLVRHLTPHPFIKDSKARVSQEVRKGMVGDWFECVCRSMLHRWEVIEKDARMIREHFSRRDVDRLARYNIHGKWCNWDSPDRRMCFRNAQRSTWTYDEILKWMVRYGFTDDDLMLLASASRRWCQAYSLSPLAYKEPSLPSREAFDKNRVC